jgi:hypothetical protein
MSCSTAGAVLMQLYTVHCTRTVPVITPDIIDSCVLSLSFHLHPSLSRLLQGKGNAGVMHRIPDSWYNKN